MGLDDTVAAARAGTAEAYYDLGLRFSAGDGVELDLIEAHKWFNLAVMSGVTEAKDYRAELAAEMTPADIAEAQRKAREWLTQNIYH